MKYLIIYLLALALLSACGKDEKKTKEQKAAQAQKQADTTAHNNRIIPAHLASKWNIGVVVVKKHALARTLELPGSVEFDQDTLAVVGPRLEGRVLKVYARLGDYVKAGQVLAELDSVELARASADYLGFKARAAAAASNARREEDLANRNISSERERETTQAEASALAAQAKAAEHMLIALGLSQNDIPKDNETPLNRYRLRSPLGGLVVERNAVIGDAVDPKRTMYRVADLNHVWIKLNIYERDLSWVHPGLVAEIRSEGKGILGKAKVSYIEPSIEEESRTARVHLNFDNSKALLRPGQFVTAHLDSEGTGIEVIALPKASVETVDQKSLVFVKYPDGSFHVREVKTGTSGGAEVEIRQGVIEGEEVASTNVFLLKSEVLR